MQGMLYICSELVLFMMNILNANCKWSMQAMPRLYSKLGFFIMHIFRH